MNPRVPLILGIALIAVGAAFVAGLLQTAPTSGSVIIYDARPQTSISNDEFGIRYWSPITGATFTGFSVMLSGAAEGSYSVWFTLYCGDVTLWEGGQSFTLDPTLRWYTAAYRGGAVASGMDCVFELYKEDPLVAWGTTSGGELVIEDYAEPVLIVWGERSGTTPEDEERPFIYDCDGDGIYDSCDPCPEDVEGPGGGGGWDDLCCGLDLTGLVLVAIGCYVVYRYGRR